MFTPDPAKRSLFYANRFLYLSQIKYLTELSIENTNVNFGLTDFSYFSFTIPLTIINIY